MLLKWFKTYIHIIMQTFIAILRGINVGKNRKVLMADLKILLSNFGLSNIRTYIQSGNVIFDCNSLNESDLANKLKQLISEKFGFTIPVIIRSAEEFQELYINNPFLSNSEIEQLHLTFLAEEPQAAHLSKINALAFSPDEFSVIGQDVYIKCAGGKYSDTKLSNSFFESKLKLSATTRNWKTVEKLVELFNT